MGSVGSLRGLDAYAAAEAPLAQKRDDDIAKAEQTYYVKWAKLGQAYADDLGGILCDGRQRLCEDVGE